MNATIYNGRDGYDVLPDVADALIERGVVVACRDHGYAHCPLLLADGKTWADVDAVDTEVSRKLAAKEGDACTPNRNDENALSSLGHDRLRRLSKLLRPKGGQ